MSLRLEMRPVGDPADGPPVDVQPTAVLDVRDAKGVREGLPKLTEPLLFTLERGLLSRDTVLMNAQEVTHRVLCCHLDKPGPADENCKKCRGWGSYVLEPNGGGIAYDCDCCHPGLSADEVLVELVRYAVDQGIDSPQTGSVKKSVLLALGITIEPVCPEPGCRDGWIGLPTADDPDEIKTEGRPQPCPRCGSLR